MGQCNVAAIVLMAWRSFMTSPRPSSGIAMAFVCLGVLGVMPILSNSRPAGFDALGFAALLSFWQLVFSVPLVVWGLVRGNPGIFAAHLPLASRRRVMAIILFTGAIFGASTYLYVVAVEKAGAVSAAIAIQAYPLFAMLWETLFLRVRKTVLELLFTGTLLVALYVLATEGTGRIAGFSPWFAFALLVPFLWSVAHVIVKQVLDHTPITPAQVTFFRVLVSSVVLGAALAVVAGPLDALRSLWSWEFQAFGLSMGLLYYLELIFWFHAVRHISVSMAGTIVLPWPALTMILVVPVLGEAVQFYQVVVLGVVAASLYGLLHAEKRARRRLPAETA